ncbi:nitrilase-related carbon-nitrogen hydrolase [Carboxylicivirga sp. N1Y90]|uniref:nitrilase-related carbon-nitrogen hydrolase n=1 Tax=Carboxylicivirga fragile TaxID=3417571 RepID=UPI003D346101|nr:hypothetical protein [Marinilabiliaceae bacterium N1Y90]
MKVAAVNAWSEPLNTYQNIKGIGAILMGLQREGVEYALFPELCVSGYLNSKKQLATYIDEHSLILDQLHQLSSNTSLVFSVGLPVPLNSGWGIGQLTFKKGKLISQHAKTHLSVHEKETFEAGTNLKLAKVSEFKMGMHLCLESHYPELSMSYQHNGANLLCYAFASPRESPEKKLERFSMYLRARAYDNACYVMACNQTGLTPSGKRYSGAALIISPRGEVLAQSFGEEANYCIANIELNSISKIKNSQMSDFPAYRNAELEI